VARSLGHAIGFATKKDMHCNAQSQTSLSGTHSRSETKDGCYHAGLAAFCQAEKFQNLMILLWVALGDSEEGVADVNGAADKPFLRIFLFPLHEHRWQRSIGHIS